MSRASLGEAGTPALAARLHSITGGNPFFLGELIRGVDADELARWGDREGAQIRPGASPKRSGR